MSSFSQYELWVPQGDHWHMIASFRDFDIAYAVARKRNARVRLVQVTYDRGKPVEDQTLADMGATREQP